MLVDPSPLVEKESMKDDDPAKWTDLVDSLARDIVPRDIVEMDQKRKHARVHYQVKKEEVKTRRCARVPSYLA